MLAKFSRAVPAVVAAAVLLAACGTMDKVAPGRKKIDYRKSEATEALEVPPDLSSNTINKAPDSVAAAATSYSEYGAGQPATGAAKVLPDQQKIRVERDGDQQWLVVQGAPDQVWLKVREFWLQEGFLIQSEDPRTGVLVTGWSENRADIPEGPIRNLLGKVVDSVYSSATRDQYRVRLERGQEAGTTEIYLTHRGVEEVVKGTVDATATWQPRPSDPELEAAMMKRLMVFLGVEEQKALAQLAKPSERKVRARMVSNEQGSMLIVDEDFSRAWRRTGVALDRVSFAVEDRNRSEGIYYVRYNDPLSDHNEEGMLSKLAFWSSDDAADATQYQIRLQAQGPVTHIVVNDAQGERDTTPTAKRILSLLEEQLQ
ncbi:MAG: outer membrane protein assembly factor BamC [Gammaproteobacteria bacterium]|jgi:outer membrane protein assembly factor BamC